MVFINTLTQRLKKRLSWLSSRVIVASKSDNLLSGKLQADFLPEP